MNKKVISFSLWGNKAIYVLGAILNADMASEIWKGWICRFYVSPNVPESAVKELESRDNVEVVRMEQDESWNGMFWRFYTASDPEVEITIFRDTDSRIGVRDKAAVDEWLNSNKNVHIMRDACVHGWQICGGAWGVRNYALTGMKDFIDDFDAKKLMNKHGVDQIYLSYEIYPLIESEAYIHDEYGFFEGEETHPFPISRLKGEGWWESDFPEWHSGIERDGGPWNNNHEGTEGFKCPACGEYHDNEYIGKICSITKEQLTKYDDIMKDLK